MKFRVLMALVSVVLLGVFAQSAAAALGPAEPLSAVDANSTDDVRTHIDAAGNATTIWSNQEDSFSAFDLLTRTRTSSGGWTEAQMISDFRAVGDFDVAFSSNGHVIVTWTETNMSIWAVRRSPAGVWSDPVQVQAAEGVSTQRAAQVAVDPQGNGVIAWRDERPDPIYQVAAFSYFSTNTGSWSTPDEIDEAYSGEGIDVIYDNAGSFVSVWHSQGTPGFVKSSSRPVGEIAAWTTPAVVHADPSGSYRAAIAADASGNVTIAWGQYVVLPDPPYSEVQFWASHRAPGGPFDGPHVVAGTGSNLDNGMTQRPLLFAHPDGKFTAGWVNGPDGAKEFLTSTWSTNDVWSSPVPVGTSDVSIDSLVGAVDANGLKTFAWRSLDSDDDTRIQLRTQDAAGVFGSEETLALRAAPDTSPSFPSVSAAGNGAASVAWRANETQNTAPARIWARYSAPAPAAQPPVSPTSPQIGRVTISPKKVYRTARVKGSKKKRRTAGKVQFSLSEPATVTLEFQLRTSGRQVNGKCVKKSRKNTRRRACERVSPWGKPITSAAGTGASSINFSAKRLRKGNYYVIVKATAPSGATATPVRAKLTVG